MKAAGSNIAVGSKVAPDAGVAEVVHEKPPISVQALLEDQRAALARGDIKALAGTVAPQAIGFGVDADEIAEGRDAIEAQLRHDLGELPAAGVTVESKFSQVGEERNHAWTAQELVLSAPGRKPQRFVITQLAASIGGKWMVVAWHWGIQVRDDDAERVAILGTKPVPKPIANKLDGPKELEATIRTAFASRRAFGDARSDREDDFNFGSAPGERIIGGASIKRVFRKSTSEVRLHDGVRAVAGNVWDPAQKDAPWIAFAAINADLLLKTKAATDLTQTFRVLVILLKEGSEWKIVQAQFTHGGPIRPG